MDIQITHVTRYRYDQAVQLLPHLLYLRPRENPSLQVRDFRLRLEPDARLDWLRDDFDNLAAIARFPTRTSVELVITAESRVATSEAPPFDFIVHHHATYFPFTYEPLHRANLAGCLAPPAETTRATLKAWLDDQFAERPRETVAWIAALNRTIGRAVSYRPREQAGIQSSPTTLALGTGSCRDLAVVLIDCARTFGLAARFVSGYMLDAEDTSPAGNSMHAWVDVFLPGAGWRGLDPTHGIFCDHTYVPVAHAVVAESVNPVQGAFGSPTPARARMTTEVEVRELREPAPGATMLGRAGRPVAATSHAGNTPSRDAAAQG